MIRGTPTMLTAMRPTPEAPNRAQHSSGVSVRLIGPCERPGTEHLLSEPEDRAQANSNTETRDLRQGRTSRAHPDPPLPDPSAESDAPWPQWPARLVRPSPHRRPNTSFERPWLELLLHRP